MTAKATLIAIKKEFLMSSVTIKTGGEQYKITLSRPSAAVGVDAQFSEVLALLTDGFLEDYSPAFGEPAAFVANRFVVLLGATVVAIDAPASEKGLIY